VAKTQEAAFTGPNGKKKKNHNHFWEGAIFLDSRRLSTTNFDVINLGLLRGTIAGFGKILLELKHIADSKDLVKGNGAEKGWSFWKKSKNQSIKIIAVSQEKRKNHGFG